MKGWFDAFREEGAPTLYAYHNRTAVAADAPALALLVAALTLYVAFLAVFPGIRKEKFSTFTTVTLSLFVGTVILVCKRGSAWHTAHARVARATYRAFSAERLDCWLAVHVGLGHVNVTLTAVSSGNASMSDVDYNERFVWEEAGAMMESYSAGLARGLPYPVLSVAEHFALQYEGFDWGAKYRGAGYTVANMLWAALALWLVMNLLLVVVPRYGAYAMCGCGAALVCACSKLACGVLRAALALWLVMNLLLVVVPRYGAYAMCGCGAALVCAAAAYWAGLPRRALVVRIDGAQLHFALGWCFWLVLFAGVICLVIGAVISAVDVAYPHRFSTVLEVDYDTPYDRHVLIVDSQHSKSRAGRTRQTLSSQTSLPSRILRRLSSKTRELDSAVSVCVVNEADRGRDNAGFQHERAPKSPWRYPLFRRPLPHPMDRADSASSFGSSTTAGVIKMSPLATSSVPPHRLRPQIPATERVKEMW